MAVWTSTARVLVAAVMSGSSTSGVRASAFALVLVCMAMAMRVLIPQGYMVAPNSLSGSFPIVLCTSQGPQTVNLGETDPVVRSPSDVPADDSGGQPREHPCAFSGLGGDLAVEVQMIVALADWDWVRQSILFETRATPGRGLAAPPPPSTGPPPQI